METPYCDGRITRRMIGKVDVYDMSGSIKGDTAGSVREYLTAYISRGDIQGAIVNIQELQFIDNNMIQNVLHPFNDIDNVVLFYTANDMATVFRNNAGTIIKEYCNKESDVVNILGPQLVNKRHHVPFVERRRWERLKSAIATDIICRQKNSHNVTATTGIITNISGIGAFVEYLDLNSASLIHQIDYFKNMEVSLMANDPFYGQAKMQGEIVRVEISGNQTSIAVKFTDPIEIPDA